MSNPINPKDNNTPDFFEYLESAGLEAVNLPYLGPEAETVNLPYLGLATETVNLPYQTVIQELAKSIPHNEIDLAMLVNRGGKSKIYDNLIKAIEYLNQGRKPDSSSEPGETREADEILVHRIFDQLHNNKQCSMVLQLGTRGEVKE
jgi:hypothetical protein